MPNLVQPITRNTSRGSRIKVGISSGRVALHEEIFQRILQTLHRRFFVFGIFAPVGAYSIKEGNFHMQRDTQPFVQSNSQFSISKEKFSI